MEDLQNGVSMDSAAPRAELAPKLGLVSALIPLRLTMVQTVGDLGTKHRIVPQDHAQVKFSSHQSSSVGSYRSGNYYHVKYVNEILVLNISQF